MEFPLAGLTEMNSSEVAAGQGGSLYGRKPVLAALYVGVLGVAAVVGTFGNLVVIVTVIFKHIRSRRTTKNDVGKAFIANLASSDLIVTSVINPLAIAGLFIKITSSAIRQTSQIEAIIDNRGAFNDKVCCREEAARCFCKFRLVWSVQAVVQIWFPF